MARLGRAAMAAGRLERVMIARPGGRSLAAAVAVSPLEPRPRPFP
jgi:hypothetical protein